MSNKIGIDQVRNEQIIDQKIASLLDEDGYIDHGKLHNALETPRRGYVLRGIHQDLAETKMEHSLRVMQAAVIISQAKPFMYDAAKMQSLALFHDYVEAVGEDLTPEDNISPEQKRKYEHLIIQKICEKIPGGNHLYLTIMEYERQESEAAQMVFLLDKMDASVKAQIYLNNFDELADKIKSNKNYVGFLQETYKAKEGDPFIHMRNRLQEFHPYNQKRITHPFISSVLEDLVDFKGKDVQSFYFSKLGKLDRF